MLLKCVETIYHPSLRDEEIVHPYGKSWDKVHNRNGHRFCDPTESTPGNSRSVDPDRCRDEHRPPEIIDAVPGYHTNFALGGFSESPSASVFTGGAG